MLKIASAQYPISHHANFFEWKTHVREWIQVAAGQGANLLVFPEYGSMELVSLFDADIRQDLQLQVRELDRLKEEFCETFAALSAEFNVTIVAPTLPILKHENPINRAYVFSKGQTVGYQDKLFMTRFETEEWGVKSGEPILTLFEADWGSFGIQICYDIEFPIGSALLAQAGANMIIAPSCTETLRGATRVHVGARARAMENQLYTVVAQTVGEAKWSPAVDVNFGYAAAYSTPDNGFPEEGILSSGTPQEAKWLFFEPNFELLRNVRQDGQVFNYRDMSQLTMAYKNERISVQKAKV
jgi:predicted amidohydrolase